jgi:hypothetical protein
MSHDVHYRQSWAQVSLPGSQQNQEAQKIQETHNLLDAF